MKTRPEFWTPTMQHRPMSTSGGIVLWWFFWPILLLAYMLRGFVWITAVVVVNTLTFSWWVSANAAILAWSMSHTLANKQRRLPR